MKHLLIYLPLANRHRAPIINQLVDVYISKSYKVSIILESKVCVFLKGVFKECSAHEHFIAKYLDFDKFENVFFFRLNKSAPKFWANEQCRRESFYKKHLSEGIFDEVLIWNGNFDYQQTFVKCLQAYPNIQKNFVEVGWFDQSNSVYIDKLGVNAESLISRTCPPALTEEQAKKTDNFMANYAFTLKKLKHNDSCLKILVPLQVDTDTNIINHSPFKAMKEFISFLESWIPEKNVEVLIRAHPKALYSYQLMSKRRDFIFDNTGDIKLKIAQSDVVVGINSTVLVQALAFSKPVLAFGEGVFSSSKAIAKPELDSSFSIPEFCKKSAQELINYLALNKQIPITKATANSFVKYIQQRIYLIAVKLSRIKVRDTYN